MSSLESPSEPLWTAAYIETHMDELNESTSLFETIAWTLATTNPVAENFWTTSGSGGSLHEAGHFTLTHVP